MKRILVYLGVLLVVIAGGVAGEVARVYAEPVGAWDTQEVSVVARTQAGAGYGFHPCAGELMTVNVESNGVFADSCVFGSVDSLRVARFYTGSTYLYAVSFPYESSFYELRGACSIESCAYSAGTDTLLTHRYSNPYRFSLVVYKNLSTQLERHFDAAKLGYYYQFSPGEPDYELKVGSYYPSVGAIGVAKDGKWAVLEIKNDGVARLDLETFDVRRVHAPSVRYGYGSDPMYELAISNDGKHIAHAGWNVSFRITNVDETCGDRPTEQTSSYFDSTIIQCQELHVSNHTPLGQYVYASLPRFNQAGNRLGITVHHAGSAERILLSPFPDTYAQAVDYLALGDSFTSGEGEIGDEWYRHSPSPLHRCHVSTRAYPYLLGTYWGVRTENVACSGARTIDVVGAPSYAGQADALLAAGAVQRIQLQESALDTFQSGAVAQREFVAAYQPQLVSLGIGGNDAGLMGKLAACLGFDTCEWASDPAKRYATAREIGEVFPRVLESIDVIRNESPSTRILVVGYPNIINAHPDAACDALLKLLLSNEERVFIRESLQYLNEVIAAAATAKGVAYANIQDGFAGRELCQGSNTAAMNGVRLGDDIAPFDVLKSMKLIGAESFHPTPYGHFLTSRVVQQAYPSFGSIQNTTIPCCVTIHAPQPSTYWIEERNTGQPYVAQRYSASVAKGVVEVGEDIDIQAEKMQFAPGTTVSIALHSSPVALGATETSPSGAANLTVTLPENTPTGYHTLHLFGTAISGNAVDVYREILVVEKVQTSLAPMPVSTPSSALLTEVGGTIGLSSVESAPVVSTGVKGVTDVTNTTISQAPSTRMAQSSFSAENNNQVGRASWWWLGFLGLSAVGAVAFIVTVVRIAKVHRSTQSGD